MIQSDRFWLIENGLTMLECVGTSYGEMDPDGVIILVVMMMGLEDNAKPKLFSLVESSEVSLSIRTLAMSSITAIVMAVDALFEPFVVGKEARREGKENAMKDAVAILHTREEELLTIRRRALELVGKVMSHCGYECVTPYLKEVVDQMTVVRI